MIRKAVLADLPQIGQIYDNVHTNEENGLTSIGWIRTIYPTVDTARSSIEKGGMFVLERDGKIIASVVIDQNQAPEYENVPFNPVTPDKVMVLHTLAVDPEYQGKGSGSEVVRFYESYARENGCEYLRMDTNRTNTAARAFYAKNGFREVAEVPFHFDGIPNIHIVCLEKKL